jgi:hypothetical protein
MNRSFIRWAALACSAATLGFTSAGVLAQTSCPSGMGPYNLVYLGAGSAPQLVPTTMGAAGSLCAANSAPVCTIVGPNSAQIGTTNGITLVANCSGATSYAWTVASSQSGAGGGCAGGSGQTCTDHGSPSEYPTSGTSVAYTVTGTGPLGTSAPATQTVTWSTTAPAAPSGCSISGAPSSAQAAGFQATLTMNCTAGGAPTSYAWTGTGAAGMTTQTVGPITVNATTNFTATASNATGTSAVAAATVTITGGGGGGGSVVCAGFPTTLSENIAYDGPGGVGATSLTTYNTGGFAATGALVVQFTTPAVTTAPTRGIGSISLVEFSGPPTTRTGSISTTPCDFTTGITGQAGVSSAFVDSEPKVYFSLGIERSGYLQLQPSTTYYFNVENIYNGAPTCTATSTCDVKVTLTKQPGT